MNISFNSFDYKNDLNQKIELLKDCFPEAISTEILSEEYYDWKFHKCPNLDRKSYEYGAYFNKKLIGYYAAIPYRYVINGVNMISGMVCDVMTHSSMRKKGIFTKLGAHSLGELQSEKVDFATGYPIRPATIPGHLKIGWRIAFNLPLYVKILKLNSVLNNKKIGFLAPFLNFLLFLYNGFFEIKTGKNDRYTTESISVQDLLNMDEYDLFFDEWSHEQNNFLVKDRKFLRWRLSVPNVSYYITIVRYEKKIVALIITRKKEFDSIPFLGVVDIMILSSHYNCLPILFKEVKKTAKQLNAEMIGIMLSKIWSKKYNLIFNGFLKSPFIFKLIIKKMNEQIDNESLMNEKMWNLTWIDSDDL